MGHKMLLQADMKVLKEKRKSLSGGKTKDNRVAYYTGSDKSQLNRNITIFISDGLKDRAIKATKDEQIDISELREKAYTRPFTCLSCCKMSQYRFSFSYCSFLIIDKKRSYN